MTKKAMIDYIEKTGMVINFKRSRMMAYLKKDVERFYEMAIKYEARKNAQ